MFVESKRLFFKQLTMDHLQILYPLHSNPEVMKFLKAPDQSIEETRTWIEVQLEYNARYPGFGIFPAFLKEGHGFIGWGVLRHIETWEDKAVEVGYRLLPEFWGKGYATEIATVLLQYGFGSQGLKKIVGVTHPDHVVSQGVLMKCGLQPVGTAIYFGRTVNVYSIHEGELKQELLA